MKWYERLKERRIELGVTQDELAILAGYKSKVSISRIENGRADLPSEKLVKLARLLKCSPAWVLGLSGDKTGKDQIKIKTSSAEADEVMEIFNSLPWDKREKVLDYAIYLLQSSEKK